MACFYGNFRLLFTVFVIVFSSIYSEGKVETETGKKVDQLWIETGVGLQELKVYLNNNYCYETKILFISCVSGIDGALQSLPKNKHVLVPQMWTTSVYEPSPSSINLNMFEILPYKRKSKFPDKSFREWTLRRKAEKDNFIEAVGQLYYGKNHMTLNFDYALEYLINFYRREYPAGAETFAVREFMNNFLQTTDFVGQIEPLSVYKYKSTLEYDSSLSLGMEVAMVGNVFRVKKVFSGESGEKAGFRQGDEITAINGIQVADLQIDKLIEIVTSPDDKPIEMTANRKTKKGLRFIIHRTEAKDPQFDFKIIGHKGKKYQYLKIYSFMMDNLCMQIQARILASPKDIEGFILDLRDNSGGKIKEVVCIAGLFTGPGKTVLLEKDIINNKVVSHTTDQSRIVDVPIVTLINGSSASGSEALAAVIRHYKLGLLVGQRTYGKGSVNGSVWWMGEKFILWKTMGIFYGPNNLTHNRVGIIPDFKVGWRSKSTEQEDFEILSEHSDNNPTKPENGPITPIDSGYNEIIESCLDNEWILSEEKRLFGTVKQSDFQLLNGLETVRCMTAHPWN